MLAPAMITIVIPVFNEAPRLRALLPSIPARVLGVSVRTIVADDGSTDESVTVARTSGAIVVSLPVNRGKGAALKAGLAHAADLGFDYLVTMDGDGQHDPVDLAHLVRPVMAGTCDIALGTRYALDPARGAAPLNRYLVRGAVVAYLRRVVDTPYTDPFCGFRCFSRDALNRVRFQGNEYQGELEAIFDAAIHQLRVIEVPVHRVYLKGSSKMGVHHGPLLGRLSVIAQYLGTIRRRTVELRWAGAGPRYRFLGIERASHPPGKRVGAATKGRGGT
jgi:glycosyltransferase involved in cell wall biosynthesis